MNILQGIHSIKITLIAILIFATLATGFAQAQNNENSNEETIGQAELEQILAPIALYPDTILSHILIASTYPLEIVQAERWALQNDTLQGQKAFQAAEKNDWDPSVQALVAFPQILTRMSQDLAWTQRLGDAFLQDQERVLSSVQVLRELAQEAGSLDEMSKVTVSHDESSIVIEPLEREVVYVPYYDSRLVYGTWRWQNYQPTHWGYPYTVNRRARNSFYWGPSVSLSFGFFSNSFNWRNRHLVRISSRHYQPRRYHSHYDILNHRDARRWAHNTSRRHGNRNRHSERRVSSNGKDELTRRQNNSRQRNQIRQRSNQRQVRNRLENRRNNPGKPNTSRRTRTPQNRPATNQNTQVHRNTATTKPLPSFPARTRAVTNNRRVPTRVAAPPINKPIAVPTQQRAIAQPARQRESSSTKARRSPEANYRKSSPTKPPRGNRNRKIHPR